jgi:hypothetical protein
MLTECGYGLRRTQMNISGTPASSYLDGVLASTVFDLDATIAASYPGSGLTWANLATPADGAAKTAYDFFLGDGVTATTYPAFSGSAGNSAAYWSFDGGDYFDLKSGANTAFLRDAHKTTGGSDFWIAMAYRPVDGGVTQGLFTTTDGTGTAGFRTEQLGSELIQLVQRGPTTTQTNGGYVTRRGGYVVYRQPQPRDQHDDALAQLPDRLFCLSYVQHHHHRRHPGGTYRPAHHGQQPPAVGQPALCGGDGQ